MQVILTPYRSASQVVCGFDMSHACAYYDGNDVYATRSCVCASVMRVARILPGMVAKPNRVLKAKAKGFTYVGPLPRPSDSTGSDSTAVRDGAPVSKTNALTYFSPESVIAAYCFRPLSSDDYTAVDGSDSSKTMIRDPSRSALWLSKRFALAVPLMTIGWRSPSTQYATLAHESIGFRLLEAKDAGEAVSRHRTNVMRDYAEAKENVAAAAAKTVDNPLQSVALFRVMVQRPDRFTKDGFEFVRVPTGGSCQIVDGITGAPMRVGDIDASRHVFSGVMSLAIGQFTPSSPCVYLSKRMERLRVYPRAFVSMAARVMASASIIAADRFVDSLPSAD